MRNVRDAIALYLESEDYEPARLVSVERIQVLARRMVKEAGNDPDEVRR